MLQAALVDAITVADSRGAPDVAQGDFMRFEAEAAWYPTQMPPSEGASWLAIDDTSVQISTRDGDVSVALVMRSGAKHLIRSFKVDARGRIVGGKTTTVP